MKKFCLSIVGFFLILLATNQWPNFEEGANAFKASDTRSYMAIAQSFPSIGHLRLPYHHYQRFMLPFLIGSFSYFSGISIFSLFRGLSIALCVLIVFFGEKILTDCRFKLTDQALMLSVLIFNPYVMRYYLAIPVMSGDLLFMFGEILLAYGLMKKQALTISVALLIAITGRQTALLLLPAVSLWFMCGPIWSSLNFFKKVFFNIFLWILVIGIYLWQCLLVKHAGVDSNNLHFFSGMYHWITEAFNLNAFLELIIRTLLPSTFALAFVLGFFIKAKEPIKKIWVENREACLFLLFTLITLAQPLLGDPRLFLTNLIRFSGEASIFSWVAAALIFKRYGASKATMNQHNYLFFGLLIFSSFHHYYSVPGAWLYSWVWSVAPVAFATIYAICNLGAAVTCLL